MSTQIAIIAPTLPENYCPENWQALVDLIIGDAVLEFPEGYTQIIVSQSTPVAEDRGKIWFKVDGDNKIIGIFSWTDPEWTEYNPPYVFHCSNNGATDNGDVLTTTNYTPANISNGQFFRWVHTTTNTGAVTATINGGAAIPVVGTGGQALVAGELPSGWSCFAFYNGTNLVLLSPTKSVAQSLYFGILTDDCPAQADSVTFSLPSTAKMWTVALRCTDADIGFAEGDEIDIYAIQGGFNDQDSQRQAFSVTVSGTSLYVAHMENTTNDSYNRTWVVGKNGESVLHSPVLNPTKWDVVVRYLYY